MLKKVDIGNVCALRAIAELIAEFIPLRGSQKLALVHEVNPKDLRGEGSEVNRLGVWAKSSVSQL